MRFARHHSRLICTQINMKFLIFSLVLVASTSAQYVGYQATGKPIAILRQAQDISPEGSYSWSYETENGIAASESGAPNAPGPEGPAVVAQGQYQYTAPDGTPIAVSYVADENGFRPQGAHIPAVPEAIKRSLDFNAANPDSENNPQTKFQRF